jgi:hypothetical protein
MDWGAQWLLVGAVGAVGVLHTIVPDHWAPITVMARQRGWAAGETARTAAIAGLGHVASTLAIAIVVWFAGKAAAARFGSDVDTIASAALVAFGGWFAVSAWRDLLSRGGHRHDGGHPHAHDRHQHRHDHSRSHSAADHAHADDDHDGGSDPLYLPLRGASVALSHRHLHRHGRGAPHAHWHDHPPATAHVAAAITLPLDAPLHEHVHRVSGRAALLLILGSSPMVEGIPAFFTAERYGPTLIAVMAAVFALATIATYVAMCVISAAGLQRLDLGPVERYGEVIGGIVIAAVGLVFWLWVAT